jgi:hypothetical protein
VNCKLHEFLVDRPKRPESRVVPVVDQCCLSIPPGQQSPPTSCLRSEVPSGLETRRPRGPAFRGGFRRGIPRTATAVHGRDAGDLPVDGFASRHARLVSESAPASRRKTPVMTNRNARRMARCTPARANDPRAAGPRRRSSASDWLGLKSETPSHWRRTDC